MKKIIGCLMLMILIVSCSDNNQEQEIPNEPEAVEFSYRLTENIEFVEGEEIDFSQHVFGNHDQIEFDEPETEVGSHLLRTTLYKDGQTKVIGIPYEIIERPPSNNYYLASLSFDGYKLEPSFNPSIDSYKLELPKALQSYTISASTEDENASITNGVGIWLNPGVDYTHQVVVSAENLETFTYYIEVVFVDEVSIDEDIETFNGLFINYPDSNPVVHRNDLLTLVNKSYRLDKEYEPEGLIEIDRIYTVYGNGALIPEAYDAYMKMREDAAKEGLVLNVSNCYRSYARQKELYTHYLSIDSQDVVDTYSARPGHSEHQLGVACDFAANQLNIHDFTGTAEQLWMVENAHDYGFILRYPEDKVDVTGYNYESWHYRYVGDVATQMTENGLTLEEYLNQ